MGSFSIWHLLILLVLVPGILALTLVPIAKIVRRAGYSGWFCLMYFVPLVNLVMLWVFAFAEWPALDKNS